MIQCKCGKELKVERDGQRRHLKNGVYQIIIKCRKCQLITHCYYEDTTLVERQARNDQLVEVLHKELQKRLHTNYKSSLSEAEKLKLTEEYQAKFNKVYQKLKLAYQKAFDTTQQRIKGELK